MNKSIISNEIDLNDDEAREIGAGVVGVLFWYSASIATIVAMVRCYSCGI